jgi:hypothetical protein
MVGRRLPVEPMPARSQGWRHPIGIVLLIATLAGCETTRLPLMSPLQVARSFGYADTAIGDNRYQVTYVRPSSLTFLSRDIPQSVGADERTRAFDFAVWRAAQIAIAERLVGFRVVNVRSNVNVDVLQERPSRRYRGPSPYAYQQAEVTIDAQMTLSPGSGDYVARDVINQMRRRYPEAEGAPATTIAPS